VARSPDPVLKQHLLDQVVRYLADHGLGVVSLRPMAEALHMSPHRLVHHFGAKDQLLAAALTRAIEIQEEIQEKWFAAEPDLAYPDLLRKWWYWLVDEPANLALVRLGLEAAALDATVTGLPTEVRAQQIGVWRELMEVNFRSRGLDRAEATVEASLVKAAFTGLIIDFMVSGDRRRCTRALELEMTRLEERLARPR
jgi:AcrR family transcriptional regulator